MTRLRPRRDPEPWNATIQHHAVVLEAVPAGCRRALDVGCGEGILTRALRPSAALVVGLDRDRPSLERARARGADGVAYVLGDVLAAPFRSGSFDLVTAAASLHHVDARAGLRAMAALLRPGGVLAVIGMARPDLPADLPRELAGAVLVRLLQVRRRVWRQTSPVVWPPPATYAEMRRIATEVLPGVRYRRHLLFRYTLVWTKPA